MKIFYLKEKNKDLNNELGLLSKRVNMLEQNQFQTMLR